MGQEGWVVQHQSGGVRVVVAAAVVAAVVATGAMSAPATSAEARDDSARLHLVTFERPGTASHHRPLRASRHREVLRREQDVALERVGAPAPVYRWTTALSGVAVQLTPSQVRALRSLPAVTLVEENAVRSLAARPGGSTRAWVPAGQGGAGVVVGVVDSGVWPDSPVLADTPELGRPLRGFAGGCQAGEEWDDDICSDKIVSARWFVDGFGAEAVSSAESLSPRDVLGHGTQMASVAVGNSGVSTGVPGLPRHYSGTAPRSRLAVYKACWGAPDPRDDGCATADLVTAVDRAVADGVDVLTMSVTGSPDTGSVERALLGAAEAGIVVVAAAGNDRPAAYAAPREPWVITVGGLAGTGGAGTVSLPRGPRLQGAMSVRRARRAAVVLGRDVPAEGWSARQARTCVPGSLDAARVAGAIVVCERGSIARLQKSAAVERADGVGMVLVNVGPGGVAHDLHAVPTVHLDRPAGQVLRRWVSRHPGSRVRLVPTAARFSRLRVGGWSAAGDPAGGFVKPDLVAPATGVLAATPPGVAGEGRWGLVNGTSAAAARTAGAAAVLLSRHDWPASVVRSALATSAAPLPDALRSGAGRLRLDVALRTRLAYVVEPAEHREWLEGEGTDVNTPSLLLRGGAAGATRTLTNLDDHARYWSVRATGFERHDVRVTPAALRLGPGESASFTVTVVGGARVGALDDGTITWRGPEGVPVRMPVVIGR